ncbi:biotin-dependent carboxylase uncharacterized domain-containing protein [Alteromonadaceae bacterium Bs31]|nr:biotin-dependent carboxylase uncharacterized domain-containing protein [Alteromonadaceae bacterium Bs31]
MQTDQVSDTGKLTLLKPGPMSSLQDRGRQGCQHLGLCSGGAADGYAFKWANRLLDNPDDAACLEITLGPCEIHFSHAARIALCGASSECCIAGNPIPPWGTWNVGENETLSIPMAKTGLRFYLAVEGGFIAKKIFNSFSSLNPDGSLAVFKEGDKLAYPISKNKKNTLKRSVYWKNIPDFRAELTLRLHPSYQYSLFSGECRRKLFSSCYTLSPQCNRMGYRLQGDALKWERGGIVSEGIAYGAVQIPPDGQPIVLLNDRQTIGGYPKIGCVSAEDCYLLAQRRPGQKVRFVLSNE